MRAASPDLILASTSATRIGLLKAAGVSFRAVSPEVDEGKLKAENRYGSDLVMRLAALKAVSGSQRYEDSLVIGADQILVHEDEVLSKPAGLEGARQQLVRLRGKTHTLVTSVAVARARSVQWSHTERAELTMRDFSDEFLEAYLAHEAEGVTRSVGGYQIEGAGLQLFSCIDGEYFAILGLPMLPLLAYLREEGALAR